MSERKSERKPLLINVPGAGLSALPQAAAAAPVTVSPEIVEAARTLRAKVEQDRERRNQLIDSITDRAMRASLTKL